MTRLSHNQYRVSSRVARTAVAFIFVANYLLVFLHEATTTHSVCAEHGERIDQSTHASDNVTAENEAKWSRGELDEHHSDHCAVALCTNKACLIVATGDVAAADTVWRRVSPLVVAGLTSDDILQFAPKNSPPSV